MSWDHSHPPCPAVGPHAWQADEAVVRAHLRTQVEGAEPYVYAVVVAEVVAASWLDGLCVDFRERVGAWRSTRTASEAENRGGGECDNRCQNSVSHRFPHEPILDTSVATIQDIWECWTDTAQGEFDLHFVRDKEQREVDFLAVVPRSRPACHPPREVLGRIGLM